MGRYGYDYGYSPGRRGIKKSNDPTIKIKPKELGVGALLVGALGSLSGSKNKKQTGKKSDVSAPVSKPKIVKTPREPVLRQESDEAFPLSPGRW